VTDLKISVAPILHERGAKLPVDQWIKVPASFIVDGSEETIEVHLAGTLTNTGNSFVFSGTVTAEVPVQCHRCLRTFVLPVQVNAVEEFRRRPPGTEPPEDTEDAVDKEADAYSFAGTTVDFEHLVREYLVLAMPIKTVCSPECRGICRQCGQELNTGDCQCQDEDIDPRFAMLSELLDKMKDK